MVHPIVCFIRAKLFGYRPPCQGLGGGDGGYELVRWLTIGIHTYIFCFFKRCVGIHNDTRSRFLHEKFRVVSEKKKVESSTARLVLLVLLTSSSNTGTKCNRERMWNVFQS